MERTYFLNKMQEKKDGRGEDSDPILFHNENTIVVGVFDGMGGAGGAECDSDYTVNGQFMTKAYIGSRIVRDAIDKAINGNPSIVLKEDFAEILKQIITERYAAETEKYAPKAKAGLRSALIKEYPTTLAITTIVKDKDKYLIDSYWAGDSRNYIWNAKGLFQISIDDLKGNLDPLQNLHEDAPMSNCIQADGPFKIRHWHGELPLGAKFAVISATDGCFGYYPSPMDFHKALINSIKASNDFESLKEKLTQAFAYVTADDFSFSIAFVGFKKFKELNDFKSYDSSLKQYFYLRRDFEEKVRKSNRLKDEIASMSKELDSVIEELWPKYKRSYLKYMDDYEER